MSSQLLRQAKTERVTRRQFLLLCAFGTAPSPFSFAGLGAGSEPREDFTNPRHKDHAGAASFFSLRA